MKATSEVPICQDTICHLFVIGISKQHPINGRDIIDLVECLVKRAAGLHPLISEDFQVLTVDRVQQIMEILFQLAAYNYPDSITLPKDYHPPKMAISSAYWKAWQILVLLCAHNPSGKKNQCKLDSSEFSKKLSAIARCDLLVAFLVRKDPCKILARSHQAHASG